MGRLDVLLRGGEVVDGSGSPPYPADVGSIDGRLVVLPPGSGAAAEHVVEARGHVVAPGFIDVHTHSDVLAGAGPDREQLRRAPLLQGVTTEVCGNCGITPFPALPHRLPGLAELVTATFGAPATAHLDLPSFAASQEGGRRTNLLPLVGHGALRAGVVGFAERPATATELAVMCGLLDDALRQGAAGLSTGLIYVPGTHAGTEEIIALARVAAAHGKPYVTHLRDEMAGVEEALEEALAVARASGAALQVSHHKTAGRRGWGATVRTLTTLIEAQRDLDVRCDVYPYTAGSTALHAMLPPWTLQEGVSAMLAEVARAEVRDRVRQDIAEGLEGWENTVGNSGWDRIVVASAPRSPAAQGRSVADLAAASGADAVDMACDLLRANDGDVTIVSHSMREDDVRRVLASPLSMIGSDGVPKPGLPHPRWAGTFARVLGHYVRDEGLLSLEEAVHKMTGASARRFGLAGRGEVRSGWTADLVVFDPQEVADTATYADPLLPPDGVRTVVVAGRLVVDGGEVQDACPGRVLTST
ncbi:N-acyl-D-amino-acid deacylase family protein [Blastococcus xanthinilyticus]|uniref:Dihydroorotase/N-acyl-D-amino-acid deacylase n=1 Tax=Blastococcus xanthinilyticus TaxID=1564164 RepID=A0A5S5CXU2_9ACTN|nr:D-aminoacylase [Blastococcus xanthinilyticus]TYP88600.1 dihydroorotase/N-acyl-D-amino-acid deacylase [Blastococcus xanthinilyticus]